MNKLPTTTRIYPPFSQSVRFCLWDSDLINGRKTKVPYKPISPLVKADTTNINHFTDYETAKKQADLFDKGLGVGIFNGLCAIDIDHCISDTGELTDIATDIISTLNTYTELSPSKQGIHLYFYINDIDKLKDYKSKYYVNKLIEVYISGYTNRFLTYTGDQLGDYKTVKAVDSSLVFRILDKYSKRPQNAIGNATERHRATQENAISDRQLLSKAHSSYNGDLFRRLWCGDITGYKSASEGDLALMNLLAFWCAGDRERMIRLFLQSGLVRQDKRRNREQYIRYLEETANNSISTQRTFYNPNYKSR